MCQHNQENSTSSSPPEHGIHRISDWLSEPEGTFTRIGETRKKPEIVEAKDKNDFIFGVTPIIEDDELDGKDQRRKVVYAVVIENPLMAKEKQGNNTLRRTKVLRGDSRDLMDLSPLRDLTEDSSHQRREAKRSFSGR